jgi:hypothetical protein
MAEYFRDEERQDVLLATMQVDVVSAEDFLYSGEARGDSAELSDE